jgi:hypothetical protein
VAFQFPNYEMTKLMKSIEKARPRAGDGPSNPEDRHGQYQDCQNLKFRAYMVVNSPYLVARTPPADHFQALFGRYLITPGAFFCSSVVTLIITRVSNGLKGRDSGSTFDLPTWRKPYTISSWSGSKRLLRHLSTVGLCPPAPPNGVNFDRFSQQRCWFSDLKEECKERFQE